MAEGTEPDRGVVLFVDDEEKSRKYFQRVFGRTWNVVVVEDGRRALELYEQLGDRVRVVVTDQIMPRLTGLELLRVLRDKGASVVRVLSTAYTDSALVEEAVGEGLIDYFVGKPWDLEKMEEVLEQAEVHYHYRLSGEEAAGQVA